MNIIEPAARARSAASSLAWLLLACLPVIAFVSLGNLARQEFGPLRNQAIQIDELYFAACAARATATGEIPIAGCHDSKGPLIYLVYQLVQSHGAPYDLVAIKIAAFATVVLIVALVCAIAYRLAGVPAAVAAPALLTQVFADRAILLAFKPDTVGAVFLLAGLAVLAWSRSLRSAILFAAGCLFGAAFLTKQIYGVAAIVAIGWLLLSTRTLRLSWRPVLAFFAGSVMPPLLFLAIFVAKGQQVEYLASLFFYPAIYGSDGEHGKLRLMAWRVAAILQALSHALVLVGLFAASGAAVLAGIAHDRRFMASSPGIASLILAIAVTLFGAFLWAPVFFSYHLVPVWTLMAIVAGAGAGAIFSSQDPSRSLVAICLAVGLLASAVASAGRSWQTNGGRVGEVDSARNEGPLVDRGGGYAYVLGTWPNLYVYGSLVPASDILLPWALPGAPANWFFTPPDPQSAEGHLLAHIQKRNLPRLFEDFRRTPPRYILIVDKMARAPGSSRIADIPGFDEYLTQRCTFLKSLAVESNEKAALYQCRTDP